jgi:hypothetical protein
VVLTLDRTFSKATFCLIFLKGCVEKGDYDVDQPRNTSKDPLHVPNGPMNRSKTKALSALVLNVSTKSELKGPLKYQEETLVHHIHVQEGSNTTLFGS